MTPAGWYADPWGQVARRWWNGTEWTGHTAATGSLPQLDRIMLRVSLGGGPADLVTPEGGPAGQVSTAAAPPGAAGGAAVAQVLDTGGRPIYTVSAGPGGMAFHVAGPDGAAAGEVALQGGKGGQGSVDLAVPAGAALHLSLAASAVGADRRARAYTLTGPDGVPAVSVEMGFPAPPEMQIRVTTGLLRQLDQPLHDLALLVPVGMLAGMMAHGMAGPGGGGTAGGAHVPGALEIFRGE